jgi:hypothetical protein
MLEMAVNDRREERGAPHFLVEESGLVSLSLL